MVDPAKLVIIKSINQSVFYITIVFLLFLKKNQAKNPSSSTNILYITQITVIWNAR